MRHLLASAAILIFACPAVLQAGSIFNDTVAPTAGGGGGSGGAFLFGTEGGEMDKTFTSVGDISIFFTMQQGPGGPQDLFLTELGLNISGVAFTNYQVTLLGDPDGDSVFTTVPGLEFNFLDDFSSLFSTLQIVGPNNHTVLMSNGLWAHGVESDFGFGFVVPDSIASSTNPRIQILQTPNATINPVPEPSSLVLLLTGGIGLVGVCYRRRKRQ